MHLLFCHSLKKLLPSGWRLKPIFVELFGLKQLGLRSGLYGPGDKLTVHYLFERTLPPDLENLLCAQALVFNKIVHKEEYRAPNIPFPHLADEARAASLVNRLSFEQCNSLFSEVRDQPVDKAIALVRQQTAQEP